MSDKKIEFGDFQTPQELADRICSALVTHGIMPSSIVEPTCGVGSFVLAATKAYPTVEKIIAAEIDAHYLTTLRNNINLLQENRVQIINDNFFFINWRKLIRDLPQPVMVLGNPPWVTSSVQGSIGATNLPTKENFQQMSGMDAITGKSNFDISEWMLIHLAKAMADIKGTIAMLCKTTVARKVLKYCWKQGIAISRAEIRKIDAAKHFDVSVEACLFICNFDGLFDRTSNSLECPLFYDLESKHAEKVIGFNDEMLVANTSYYNQWRHVRTINAADSAEWRSGIKHDASKVMELRKEDEYYRNGFNELISLEGQYIYPLLKSSDIAGNKQPSRWMIVTQKKPNDETRWIEHHAPKTWRYLLEHSAVLDKRGSVIYKKRPRFSIFGVGDYAFAPYKVAISGFYHNLEFRLIEPMDGKPVVMDDTIYFLPFKEKESAEHAATLLNSEPARQFYESLIFWDAKRPITIEILKQLDLNRIAEEVLV